MIRVFALTIIGIIQISIIFIAIISEYKKN